MGFAALAQLVEDLFAQVTHLSAAERKSAQRVSEPSFLSIASQPEKQVGRLEGKNIWDFVDIQWDLRRSL
jgi:hypothetical protein